MSDYVPKFGDPAPGHSIAADAPSLSTLLRIARKSGHQVISAPEKADGQRCYCLRQPNGTFVIRENGSMSFTIDDALAFLRQAAELPSTDGSAAGN